MGDDIANSNLKNKLYLLYDEYKKRGVGSSSGAPTSTSQAKEIPGGVKKGARGRELDLGLFVLDDYKNYLRGSTSDTKSFLDKYLEEDESTYIDVLQYWKVQESRFGDLARLACDVLSIHITTVASESSFSIGAHVLNKYRNKLLPAKVQALICTRNLLHSEDDEDYEEEIDLEVEEPSNVVNVEEWCTSTS